MLLPIDDDPPRGAEGPGHRENLAWGAGNHFRLEPAVFVALTGVELPGDVGGDTAQIPNQHIPELATANGASHWCSDIDSIAGGRRCHEEPTLSGDLRLIAWTRRNSLREPRLRIEIGNNL